VPKALRIIGRIAWILPAIIGLGLLNWLTFVYPGIRMRRQHPVWFWVFIAYAVLTVVQIILVSASDGDTAAGFLYISIWFSAIIASLVMLKWWIPFTPNVTQEPDRPPSPAFNTESPAVQDQVSPDASTSNPALGTDMPAQLATHQARWITDPDRIEDAIPSAPPPQSETSQQAATVFISHATEDRESTLILAQELENQGIHTWLAFRDVQVGDNYAEEIVKAIVSADYILVVLSEAAIESPHVRREVTIGIDRGVPLLPVNMSASEDFMWSLPVDWTYWLSLAQVLRHTDEASTAQELARRITRT